MEGMSRLEQMMFTSPVQSSPLVPDGGTKTGELEVVQVRENRHVRLCGIAVDKGGQRCGVVNEVQHESVAKQLWKGGRCANSSKQLELADILLFFFHEETEEPIWGFKPGKERVVTAHRFFPGKNNDAQPLRTVALEGSVSIDNHWVKSSNGAKTKRPRRRVGHEERLEESEHVFQRLRKDKGFWSKCWRWTRG